MSKKTTRPAPSSQNRATNVSLYPLTPDQALKAVLSISKEDVRRIIGSKPGKKKP